MKLRFWMAVKAIVEIVFGIGFLLTPVWLADMFGMTLDEGGTLMARLLRLGKSYFCKAQRSAMVPVV